MNKTRRQHIIPQFYLRQFLQPGYQYRKGDQKPIEVEEPTEVAVSKDYFGKRRGVRGLDSLNDFIETKAAPIYLKLLDENRVSSINMYDWTVLSVLFANLFVRTHIEETKDIFILASNKAMELANRMLESINKAKEKGEDINKYLSKSPDDNMPSMTLDQMEEYTNRLIQPKGHIYAAKDLYYSLPSIAKCIKNMSFMRLIAPDGSFFISSDRPLYIFSISTGSNYRAGWANKKDVIGSIALSPSCFLRMWYSDEWGIYGKELPSSEVKKINLGTMMFAKREIYSPFKYPEAQDWMTSSGK